MNPHGESALLCASRPEAGPGPDLLEVALEARRSVRGVEHRAVQSADPAARDRGHPGYEGRAARAGGASLGSALEKMLERRLVRRRARTFSGVRAARLGARERGRGRGGARARLELLLQAREVVEVRDRLEDSLREELCGMGLMSSVASRDVGLSAVGKGSRRLAVGKGVRRGSASNTAAA